MRPLFSQLPHRLGSFTLTQCLALRENTDVYLASQETVDRSVILEILRDNTPAAQNAFIATARLRAKSNQPGLGRVNEALQIEGYWLMNQELPRGLSLQDICDQGGKLTPLQICRIVNRAADLYRMCSEHGDTAHPLQRSDIYTSRDDEPTFLFPMVAGCGSLHTAAELQKAIASALEPLIPVNTRGEAHARTLLDWLRNGCAGCTLNWNSLADTASRMEQQLLCSRQGSSKTPCSEKRLPRLKHKAFLLLRQNRFRRPWLLTGIYTLAAGGAGLTLPLLLHQHEPAPRLPLYPLPQEATGVMVHPVSIGQYNRFLIEWSRLNLSEQEQLHKDVPLEAHQHTPPGWSQLVAAARNGGKYNGQRITLRTPVTSITYWDAVVYARCMGGKLATYGEAEAARNQDLIEIEEEWTNSPIPDLPVYEHGKLVSTAKQPYPLMENNLSQRSRNRGFRITLKQHPAS